MLRAVRKSERNNIFNRSYYWWFLCDCGNETEALPTEVYSGHKKSCGCLYRKRQITKGGRFGSLTALKQSDRKAKNGNVYWWFQCDCDSIPKEINKYSVVNGATASCGCSTYKSRSESPHWKGAGEISGSFWKTVKYNAQVRGIPVLVSIEQAYEVFQEQEGLCALTSVPLRFGRSDKKEHTSASLDRIDSSKGYIEGNIQWVHKDINYMKMDLDQDYFIELCRAVANHADAKERGLAV